jgi:hypothetical protein
MESNLNKLKSVQAEVHPFCVVCSGSNPYGLALKFGGCSDGVLTANFQASPILEGYEGLLHGGLIASLLDGVMTNCLFAQGIVAVTAELKVRYREPVLIGSEIQLTSWIEMRYSPLFILQAELKQGDCVKATASAKFMQRHE